MGGYGWMPIPTGCVGSWDSSRSEDFFGRGGVGEMEDGLGNKPA